MLSVVEYQPKLKYKKVVRRNTRIQSIDILRGAVMLVMALDHARHFFHAPAMIDDPTNLATTTPALFFTRWITHFCAPVFLFLSGMSAYISGQTKTKKQLSAFLIKRGFWLLFVEVAIISLSLTFDPLYSFFLLQVIWAIGWSMIILGLLIRTSLPAIIITGAIIFFGHNILDYVNLPAEGTASVLWNVFLTSPGKLYAVGDQRTITVLYAILPWTAIMIAGFIFGHVYSLNYNAGKRKRIVLVSGIVVTALFILLRFINRYGDPAPWSQQKDALYSLLSFLNVTKYPPSLQYSCMTIGPALIILALIEKVKNKLSSLLVVFGRVPFFYYVCHFYLLHVICVILFFASGYGSNDIVTKGSFMFFRPLDFGFSLPVVYVLWLLTVTLLYGPCKWFGHYKKKHKKWWLSYI